MSRISVNDMNVANKKNFDCLIPLSISSSMSYFIDTLFKRLLDSVPN